MIKFFDEFVNESAFSLPKLKFVEEVRPHNRYETVAEFEIWSDDRNRVITCELQPQLGMYYYQFEEYAIENNKRIGHNNRIESNDIEFNQSDFVKFSLNFMRSCEYSAGGNHSRIQLFTKAADELRKLIK